MQMYLKDVDKYASQEPAIPADLYIRADHTDWEIRSGWELQQGEEGRWSIRLSLSSQIRFKVYSQVLDEWFGSEVLTEDTTASYYTDDHTNIILDPGTYLVVFDPQTRTVTVTQE